MHLAALPLDTDRILQDLQRWVECESPTFDAAAVNRMMDIASTDLATLGAHVERIQGPRGFGDCVKAALPHPRQGEPGILVMGHLDTVHPIGTLAQLPFRTTGDHCYGPGVVDMKGGNRAALEACAALTSHGQITPLPITFLFTSDEEIGSPGTRALIEKEARRHRHIIVPEPGGQNGSVVTGRYAIARFHLAAYGKPSHAGAALRDGRSAIREMAKRLIAIEEMTTSDCTFSVGVIHGGQWVNCVPTECRAETLAMAKRQHDLDAGVARMLTLTDVSGDARFEVKLSVVRPVWEPQPNTMALFNAAQEVAASFGSDLTHHSAGGGSDANFTGAIGLSTLDGLGPWGGGIHTLEERAQISSITERIRLLTGLFASLS